MNIPVLNTKGEKVGEVAVGKAFSHAIRTDLIQRAVTAELASDRQPYGSDPLAGKRTSAHYHGLRHYRWSMMNHEMARNKRVHNQGPLNYRARFSPHIVKGREAHPPKVSKIWTKKINQKERHKAMLSALSATIQKNFVRLAPAHALPLVFEDHLIQVKKTRELIDLFQKLGVPTEEQKSVRAGKGKTRGRRYHRKLGPLFIVHDGKIPSVPGMDVITLKQLRVVDSAPGGYPGRLCLWTKSALVEAGAW